MRVLIVDDSIVFRSAIKEALNGAGGVETIDVASNGSIAIAKMQTRPVDVVTLDLEMPDMDGIATLTEMRRLGLTPRVIIFAAPTPQSYERVREALRLGADEFLAKPVAENAGDGIAAAIERIRSELVPRIRMLTAGRTAGQTKTLASPAAAAPPVAAAAPAAPRSARAQLETFAPEAIVVASSTGGPMALEHIFSVLKPPHTRPLFLIQHMPAPFTKSLAERLGKLSGLEVAEGVDGEPVRNGRVYVAPADYHMRLERRLGAPHISVQRGPRINFVVPAADPLFETAAEVYGAKLMAFVLTGMGEDGKVGCAAVKARLGSVMLQDQATSVVWGMPGAVFETGAYDRVGSLSACADLLKIMCTR